MFPNVILVKGSYFGSPEKTSVSGWNAYQANQYVVTPGNSLPY